MIRHLKGQDTKVEFDWTDDSGRGITPTEATFTIDTETAITYSLGDPELTTGEHTLMVRLANDLDLRRGLYHYTLRANDGADWSVLSDGVLRVMS